MQFIPDKNPVELTELTDEFKTAGIMLMYRMLDSLSFDTRSIMVRLQDEQRWRIGIEITADNYGQAKISMVGISPDGIRKAFADIAEGSPPNAH